MSEKRSQATAAELTIVQCDGCKAHGTKRPGDAAPDFWFYMVTENVTPRRDGRKTDIYIVWACTEACRDGLWKRGPGPGVIDERDERKRNEIAAEVARSAP